MYFLKQSMMTFFKLLFLLKYYNEKFHNYCVCTNVTNERKSCYIIYVLKNVKKIKLCDNPNDQIGTQNTNQNPTKGNLILKKKKILLEWQNPKKKNVIKFFVDRFDFTNNRKEKICLQIFNIY